MIVIGLTGGIASGKSTVSAILAKNSAYIIDADKIAREVVEPRQPAWEKIIDFFGSDILLKNGQIDRKKLGEIVFNSKEQLVQLEKIIHPYITKEILARMEKCRKAGIKLSVLDIPLLLEKGWDKMVDEVWVVYVRPEIQLARLMARDGLNLQQAQQRINSQMSLNEKVKYADIVIDNNYDIEYTERQVLDNLSRLLG